MSWGDYQPGALSRRDAVRFIEECRAIHESYLRWCVTPNADPERVRLTGDAGNHVKWIARYDHVLRILGGRDEH